MPMKPALPRSVHSPDIGVAGAAVLGVLGRAVGGSDLADGGAQIGVFGGFGEVWHGNHLVLGFADIGSRKSARRNRL